MAANNMHLSAQEKPLYLKVQAALTGADAKIAIDVLEIHQRKLEKKHNLNNGLKIGFDKIELLMLGGNKS